MKLTTLCYAVKEGIPSIKSQIAFIDALSIAASGKKLCISNSYKKKLFNGEQVLTDNLKKDLHDENNLQSLTAFYEKIETERTEKVIAKLGVPIKGPPNKHAFAVALAVQTREIIDANTEESADVLLMEYERLCKEPDVPSTTVAKPLYIGDAVSVHGKSRYEIISTDIFSHSWDLVNCGVIPWVGRKLVYKRIRDIDRPEAKPDVIDIPEVKPNNCIKISTTFDGRGFDGVFCCKWEMQDKDGENCFPGRELLFCITIDSKYRRFK